MLRHGPSRAHLKRVETVLTGEPGNRVHLEFRIITTGRPMYSRNTSRPELAAWPNGLKESAGACRVRPSGRGTWRTGAHASAVIRGGLGQLTVALYDGLRRSVVPRP